MSCLNTLAEKIKKRTLICKTDYVDSLQNDLETLEWSGHHELGCGYKMLTLPFSFLDEVQNSERWRVKPPHCCQHLCRHLRGHGACTGQWISTGPPFHTRVLGEMWARPASGLQQGPVPRECLDFHLVATASGSAALSRWGTLQTNSLARDGAEGLLNCLLRDRLILIA